MPVLWLPLHQSISTFFMISTPILKLLAETTIASLAKIPVGRTSRFALYSQK
jgi:hypothetical protein